jgi:hypothetical protein
MGVHQGPGKDSGFRGFGDLRKARKKILAVFIPLKDRLPFASPDHHVVKGSGRIQSGSTWHEIPLPHLSTFLKCNNSPTFRRNQKESITGFRRRSVPKNESYFQLIVFTNLIFSHFSS